MFWLVAGSALLVVGLLALIFGSTDFGTGAALGGETFIIWLANGWDAVIWIALGLAGILAAGQVTSARAYAFVAGAFLAVVAVIACLAAIPTPRAAAGPRPQGL